MSTHIVPDLTCGDHSSCSCALFEMLSYFFEYVFSGSLIYFRLNLYCTAVCNLQTTFFVLFKNNIIKYKNKRILLFIYLPHYIFLKYIAQDNSFSLKRQWGGAKKERYSLSMINRRKILYTIKIMNSTSNNLLEVRINYYKLRTLSLTFRETSKNFQNNVVKTSHNNSENRRKGELNQILDNVCCIWYKRR